MPAIDLRRFYVKSMECKGDVCKKGSLIQTKNKRIGYTPRGFFFISPQVKILAIAKNPGNFQPSERAEYIGKTGSELFETHYRIVKNLFESAYSSKEASTKFHRTLLGYLSTFLGLPEQASVKAVFAKAAYTNLVKCSTFNEREPLTKIPEVVNACFETYILKEIEMFRPRVVLALGKEAYNFLNKPDNENKLKTLKSCLIGIRHPSYGRVESVVAEIDGHVKHCFSHPDSFCSHARFS